MQRRASCHAIRSLSSEVWRYALLWVFLSLMGAGAAENPGPILIPPGSTWKYLDTGTNLGLTWRGLTFDDTAWPSGPAPLGYGETNHDTVVSYGPDLDNKFVTTYFRQSFEVPDPNAFNRLFLRVMRDDGVIVYLNGVEVFRNNMSVGMYNYQTLASTNVFGPAEKTYYGTNFAPPLLAGPNVLAAEVHQAGRDSIDLNFDLELAGSNIIEVTRGPYLQMATPTNLIVRWRTALPTNSRVQYGTTLGALDLAAEDEVSTTEHEVFLPGLQPDTKYYYAIGTLNQTAAAGPDYFFVTPPTGPKLTRIWVTGDTRTGDANQAAVRDAYYQYASNRYTDLWLSMGDTVPSGSDAEFSQTFFDFYREMLRQTVYWPTIGNHETYYYDPAYLRNFSLPTNGQAGGVPSGSELYYAFDYGRIHFVVLDSITSDLSTEGPMYAWLEQDLAANRSDWLIAYWHSPPYSRNGHDSDYEWDMIQMRENFVPLLEGAGVDLVLCGHSHVYERSYLLDSVYGYSDEPFTKKDSGSGRRNNPGAYRKPSTGMHPHEGTVYAVVGSSGLLAWVGYHPAMFISEAQMGSMVIDISANTLEAKFLRETGAIDDYFTIIKGSNPEPVLLHVAVGLTGEATLTWNTNPGKSYRVLRQESLSPASAWTVMADNLTTPEGWMSWIEPSPPQTTAFYRIEEFVSGAGSFLR